MQILVTGSIAYDTIMVFPDRFKNHLLADQLHILNVCFLTPEMRREFGGTAGNIGYNLRLLGADPLLMATVGEDIDPYLARLARLNIGTALLKRSPGPVHGAGFHYHRSRRQPDHRLSSGGNERFAPESYKRTTRRQARDRRTRR